MPNIYNNLMTNFCPGDLLDMKKSTWLDEQEDKDSKTITMKWISIKDSLPMIPKGKHGVAVIVAVYDSTYAECCGGDGYSVYQASYSSTVNSKHFGPNPPDFAFQTTYYGNNDYYYGPIMDEITHWMYFPDPPKKGN